jgi:hypothetical protein
MLRPAVEAMIAASCARENDPSFLLVAWDPTLLSITVSLPAGERLARCALERTRSSTVKPSSCTARWCRRHSSSRFSSRVSPPRPSAPRGARRSGAIRNPGSDSDRRGGPARAGSRAESSASCVPPRASAPQGHRSSAPAPHHTPAADTFQLKRVGRPPAHPRRGRGHRSAPPQPRRGPPPGTAPPCDAGRRRCHHPAPPRRPGRARRTGSPWSPRSAGRLGGALLPGLIEHQSC